MNIEKLIDLVSLYNPEEVEKVRKAYLYAETLHCGQFRESGEPYIIHPLNVAYILAEMHADGDTLCAGLLHDTIEDTTATKEDIRELFNDNVANLVEGVTKLAKMDFNSKKEQNDANIKKIFTGVTTDVRIMIIKLADRLHNMRTLQFKKPEKQTANALETMHLFVPFSYYIGAYKIKNELEDISLRYLDPDGYKSIEEQQLKIKEESKACLDEMLDKIHTILCANDIPNEITVRIKNVYGIYKKTIEGKKLQEIHDLLALKILIDDVRQCFAILFDIHSKYKPQNGRIKDYINCPKTNKYQSVHTTVFGPNNRLVQTQIRTHDMDVIAQYGLTAYWDKNKGNARIEMQRALREEYPFYKQLVDMIKKCGNNEDFVNQLENELFAPKIYPCTTSGDKIELPVGSTPVDFAYRISSNLGNKMIAVRVNDIDATLNYKLKNDDRVLIITNPNIAECRTGLLDNAYTCYAKRKILEFNKRDE